MTGARPSSCRCSATIHQAFADDDVDRVAAHLERCEACSTEWSVLEALASAAKRAAICELSTAAKDELRGKLLMEARAVAKQTPARRSRSMVFALALAAGITAAIGIAVVWRSMPTRARAAQEVMASLRRATIHQRDGARFAILSSQPDEIVRLYEGTIAVDVLPLERGERFRVMTRDAEVEVHGTEFVVSASADKLTLVVVERGLVEVRSGGAAPRIVTATDRWALPENNNAQVVAPSTDVAVSEVAPAPAPAPVSGRRRRALSSGTRSHPRQHEAQVAVDIAGTETSHALQQASPASEEIAFQEGWAALRSGDPIGASRSFASVPPDAALGEDAIFWRGIALARAGRASEATHILEQFLVMFPKSPHRDEAQVNLGHLRHRMGNDTLAAASFVEAQKSANSEIQERAQRGLREIR